MLKKSILAGAVVTGLGLAWVQAQEAGKSATDEEIIRKSAESYGAAYNKGDIDSVMAYWADDADYVDNDGKTHRGKDVIAALFKSAAEGLKGHRLALKISSVRFVKPEVAIEDGVAEITDPAGEIGRSNYSAVWVKSGDNWRIASARQLPSSEDAVLANNADYLKPLAWLVGEWISDDKGPKVNLTSEWALDKQFIVQNYTVEGKDDSAVRVTMWIGYDPATGQIKSWTFDSRGGNGEGLWTREGNTWHSDDRGVLPDGRGGAARNSIRFVDDTHAEWRSTGRNVDGQPLPDAEVTFVRKGTAENPNPQ